MLGSFGLAVLASALPLTGRGPEPPTPIYGGALVEPGAWPGVVAIIVPGGLCTGTLVGERVVLTAAHCVKAGTPIAQMQVRLGDDVNLPSPSYAVERYAAHPMYCGADVPPCKEDQFDYGYVVLAEPVTGVAPVPVLTDQDQWDEAMTIGADVTLVGYGYDEGMLTGLKREVDVTIRHFSATGREFAAGGMGLDSCQGDSGGPAFVTLGSGATLLAGVTSRGYLECGKGGFYGVPYAALCWLNDETGLDLRTDACAACDCLDTDPDAGGRCGCGVSEPPWVLLGLPLVLRRRRRLSR